MILSAHQPAYLPWLGYFDKIARADIFVYLDTVQYEKNSFINRNQIKTPQGLLWLTIPVKSKGHMSSSLITTEIDCGQAWKKKHIKSIEMNYRKAANFELNFPKICDLINMPIENLADYCYIQLKFWCEQLNIKTRIVRSSELQLYTFKSDLILELCQTLSATRYFSGALGRDYLVEDDFDAAGIDVEYQNFTCLNYPQLWGGFTPNLSILDAWMNNAQFLSPWSLK